WSAGGGGGWGEVGDGVDPYVRALAVSGSNLYAGGGFTQAGGLTAHCIARWNGSSWSLPGSGMIYGVGTLAVSGNDLYGAGYFALAGGTGSNCVAKWNGSS